MGSKFKKTIIPEGVRDSLHRWQKRVKSRHGHRKSVTSTTLSDYTADAMDTAKENVPMKSIDTSSSENEDVNLESSRYFYAMDVLDRIKSEPSSLGHEDRIFESSGYFSAAEDQCYLLDGEEQSSEILLSGGNFQDPPV